MHQIKQVAIVGGTHGNELTGVYLIKKFQQYPHLIKRDNLETQLLFGNPQAIAEGRRYIDKDLNRCFTNQTWQNSLSASYEDIRAQLITQQLRPENEPCVDVILDLHTTTSNMGLTLILDNKHPFLLYLGAYLSSINPLVRVFVNEKSPQVGFLRSLSDLGLTIEVGAVPQGVLNAELFQHTEQLIHQILDFLDNYNKSQIPVIDDSFSVYEYSRAIDYPRNELGDIQAIIHPQLQFRDYYPLHPGDPIFITFDGQEIFYEGISTVYPIFINEAAYYEKNIAMYITNKVQEKLCTPQYLISCSSKDLS